MHLSLNRSKSPSYLGTHHRKTLEKFRITLLNNRKSDEVIMDAVNASRYDEYYALDYLLRIFPAEDGVEEGQ